MAWTRARSRPGTRAKTRARIRHGTRERARPRTRDRARARARAMGRCRGKFYVCSYRVGNIGRLSLMLKWRGREKRLVCKIVIFGNIRTEHRAK